MSLLLDALKKAAEQKAENNTDPGLDRDGSDAMIESEQNSAQVGREAEANDLDVEYDSSEIDISELVPDEAIEEQTIGAKNSIVDRFTEDQTLVFTDDDLTSFMGEDSDSLSKSLNAENDESQAASQDDQEVSVNLFDDDDTLLAEAQVEAPPEEIELELAVQDDTPFSEALDEVPEPEEKFETPTRIPEPITLTGTETHTRQETLTSRTFAPDNYDRTLRKSGGDDASNLFAGLKSETDVVMTPEYAKKMFLSKNSAQRVQNVKVYFATGFGILVVITVIGIFQIDQDTVDIDNSLRPLKRDPMPQMIKNNTDGKFTNIFAAEPGSEVDASTLLIVESAENNVVADEVVAIETGMEEQQVSGTSQEQNGNNVVNDSENQSADLSPTLSAGNSGSVIQNSSTNTDIKITTKSSIADKDLWLREAYAAYQRGDDRQALSKYNAVLDIDPQNRNALLARAAISVQNNRIAEAIKDYETLLIANPKDSLAMSSMIAVARYSPEQSESQLKLMIRDEPNSPHLSFALGNILGSQNRWQEAQGQYFAALTNNPEDPNYAYNLAVSLEHIAKPEVAITYYELALNNFTRGLATFDRDVVSSRLEMLRNQ